MYPDEFLSLLVMGEQEITRNFTSIKQDWCKKLQLYQILDRDFNLNDAALMQNEKCPLAMHFKMLLRVEKPHGKSIEGCTWKLRPALGLFNIYGRIGFKQKKGCSSYYRLIN